jgi:hypothetical protein
MWSGVMASIPRGLIIQMHNRGLTDEAIAQQVGQSPDVVRACVADYESVKSLLGQGYTMDEIGSTIGVPMPVTLEYLSLAYRFNPQLR